MAERLTEIHTKSSSYNYGLNPQKKQSLNVSFKKMQNQRIEQENHRMWERMQKIKPNI